MQRPTVAVIVLLGLVLAGCSLLTARLEGSGPTPEQYFEGADAEFAGAIRARDQAKIAELIQSGADVEATGSHGLTMLQYAVQTSSLPGIDALLAAGADPDRIGYRADSALHLATGDAPLMTALLEGGADPDVENPQTGETPLSTVCIALDPESFEVLVRAGADLNHHDLNGELALHTCARTNQGGIILRMLELGVDPQAPTSRGDTFQEIYFSYPPAEVLNDQAVEHRRQIVAWLLAHGYQIIPEAEPYR